MVSSIGVLECPFCDEIFEVKSPDKLHTAFSTTKPVPKSYHADVVERNTSAKTQNVKKQLQFTGMHRLNTSPECEPGSCRCPTKVGFWELKRTLTFSRE